MAETTKTTKYYATYTEGEPNAPGIELRTTYCMVPADTDPCTYIHEELSRRGTTDHNLYEIGKCENGLTVDEIEKIHERMRGVIECEAEVFLRDYDPVEEL